MWLKIRLMRKKRRGHETTFLLLKMWGNALFAPLKCAPVYTHASVRACQFSTFGLSVEQLPIGTMVCKNIDNIPSRNTF